MRGCHEVLEMSTLPVQCKYKKKWQTGRAVTRSSRVGGLSLRFKSRSFHVGNRVANDLRPCAVTSFEGVLLPGGDTRK